MKLIFLCLIKKMEMGDDYQVIDYKGKSRMSDFISMMSKTESFNENAISVAVIRDADNNYDFVAEEIKDALKRIFNVINLEHGVMKSEKDINIGFYIMPGLKRMASWKTWFYLPLTAMKYLKKLIIILMC